MTTNFALSHSSLSDEQLLASVKSLAGAERRATADLIAALAEVDRRKLYLGEGFPSLFNYCTQVLHLSEHAAYGRIEAARAVHRFPVVIDHLADGAVTLTTICLLAPLMTAENHEALLAAARHKSRREVEHLVAITRPRPDAPAMVRKLPLATTNRPRPAREVASGSRHIPAAVRREVWRRDGARCAFVGTSGRCVERGFLELHHVVPFADGGQATTSNIELRCRAHNAHEAELSFGSFVLR